MRAGWAVLAAVVALGCGGGGPAHSYRVALSEDFSGDEADRVLSALEEWEAETGVRFDVELVIAPPRGMDEDQFYVAPAGPGGGCPYGVELEAGWARGKTYRAPVGGRVVCVDTLWAGGRTVRTIALHEVGHVLLGPAHVEGAPSVMRSVLSKCSPVLTDEDVRRFRAAASW